MPFAHYVKLSLGGTILISLMRCGSVNNPEECAEIAANGTVTCIGYSSEDSSISVSFFNEVSHCPSELPYVTSCLNISLTRFEGTYQSRKSEIPEGLQLELDAEILFNGGIACHDPCIVQIPLDFPGTTVTYVRDTSGGIRIDIDTNGTFANSFKIWDYD